MAKENPYTQSTDSELVDKLAEAKQELFNLRALAAQKEQV